MTEKNYRSMSLLNKSGDTSIVWTSDVDERMLDVIRKKMKEGVTFYFIDSDLNKKPAKSVFDIGPERKIIVGDDDFDVLFREGLISTASRDNSNIHTLGRAKTAEEVASNHTVGIRPQRGG